MSYSSGGRGNPRNISKAEPMKTFAITNIQRRTVTGSFIGMAADLEVECSDADIEHLSVIVRERIGGAGYPSFSYEEVQKAA
jgi:hypothetical protein